MSWHYSRALVEAYSQADCSDGEQSALSSSIDTHETFCSHVKTTDALSRSRSGMTCGHLMDAHGEALLTWFREDSRAKTSAQPEQAQESKARNQDSGQRWRESFAKFDPDTRSLKTVQCSLLEDSTAYYATLPRWGSMSSGELSERTRPAHLTSVTGFGSLLPTPTAHNAKETNAPSEATRNTPTLAAQVGGKLNPTWVEWLMGWPLGWTDLSASATDKFQAWLSSHGAR
jgi:hypothetical protein